MNKKYIIAALLLLPVIVVIILTTAIALFLVTAETDDANATVHVRIENATDEDFSKVVFGKSKLFGQQTIEPLPAKSKTKTFKFKQFQDSERQIIIERKSKPPVTFNWSDIRYLRDGEFTLRVVPHPNDGLELETIHEGKIEKVH